MSKEQQPAPLPPRELGWRNRATTGLSSSAGLLARGLRAWASVHRVALLEAGAVVIGTVAVTLCVTWPLALHLNDSIFGLGGDSTGTIWWLSWMADGHGFDVTGVVHHNETGWPFGWDQGNGVNVQWALVFFPGYLLTLVFGEVVAYNLVVLSGLAFSGMAMYLLVRRLGAAPLVCGWAALVYIVFPWHLEKAGGHAAFTHLEGFPLLVLVMLAWHRQPSRRLVFLIALLTAALWMTSGYFGIIEFVGFATLLALATVGHWRRFGLRRALRAAVAAGGAVVLVIGIVTVLARLGSLDVGIAAPRDVSELEWYGSRAWEFVLPSYRNPTFGDHIGHWLTLHLHGSNPSETSLYVGWLTILLACGWFFWSIGRRQRFSDLAPFAAVALPFLAVSGVIFSLPSPLPGTHIETPVRLIYEVTPQFRVASRFFVLVMTALVPLAALGLEAIRRGTLKAVGGMPGHLVGSAFCIGAGVISVVELTIVPPAVVTNVARPPAQYRAVEKAPPGALAEYPLASPGQGVNSDYLLWQRRHHRALLNGGPLGTISDDVRQVVLDPRAPQTAEMLAALGVSVIITRPSTYGFTGGPVFIGSPGPGYRNLGDFENGVRVWQVVARPAPAMAVFSEGFYPAETPTGQPTTRWMAAPMGTVDLYARRRGTYEARFDVNSYGHSRLLQVVGKNSKRGWFVTPGPTPASLRFKLPAGWSSFRVATASGPEPLPDGRTASVYMTNWQMTRVRHSRPSALQPLTPLGATDLS